MPRLDAADIPYISFLQGFIASVLFYDSKQLEEAGMPVVAWIASDIGKVMWQDVTI